MNQWSVSRRVRMNNLVGSLARFKFHLLLCTFLILTACHIATPRVVSSEESAQLIAAIQGPGEPAKEGAFRWMQPESQSAPCKVYIEGKQDNTQRVLWDGACKEGYAFGLGRVFVVNKSPGGTHGWISRYHGGETPPTYFAWGDFTQQAFFFGDISKGYVIVSKAKESSEGYMQYLMRPDGASLYRRTRWVATGVTEATHFYPSTIAVVSQTRSNPADEIASHAYAHKNYELYGYGIVKLRDRSLPLEATGAIGIERLTLPLGYVDFLKRSASETNQQLAAAEQYAGEGFRVMLRYRKTFCVTPPSTFEEPAHYRDICQPLGDLTSVVPKLSELERVRSAKELSSAQALPDPTVRIEQVQLSTVAQNKRYVTLSATVNRMIAQMSRVPAGTYLVQDDDASEAPHAAPFEQPYCYDLNSFSPCARAYSSAP